MRKKINTVFIRVSTLIAIGLQTPSMRTECSIGRFYDNVMMREFNGLKAA